MASFGGSSNPNPTKMVTFKISDGELVKVPVEIVRMFTVVKDFYNGDLDDPAEPENSSLPSPTRAQQRSQRYRQRLQGASRGQLEIRSGGEREAGFRDGFF